MSDEHRDALKHSRSPLAHLGRYAPQTPDAHARHTDALPPLYPYTAVERINLGVFRVRSGARRHLSLSGLLYNRDHLDTKTRLLLVLVISLVGIVLFSGKRLPSLRPYSPVSP